MGNVSLMYFRCRNYSKEIATHDKTLCGWNLAGLDALIQGAGNRQSTARVPSRSTLVV